MSKEITTFSDYEIEKQKIYNHKNSIFKKDVDIDKISTSSKNSSGEKSYKQFVVYIDYDYRIKPLHTMLPKTSAYVKSDDGETKWRPFLIGIQ